MPDASRKRLIRTTIIYWMLLLYIIAALVWWFISLNVQNDQMMDFEIKKLEQSIDKSSTPVLYQQEHSKIIADHRGNRTKFLGEGAIFLLVILVGALFVYRYIRHQFKMQQQQQNFVMAVTHELKTPISVARLNLETIQKYTLDAEKQKKLIRMTLEETGRLNFLTNNILMSAQLDVSGYKSAKDDLNLSGLLEDCLDDFKQRFPERVVEQNIEADADVRGDAFLLQIMINNLLENAIKYSSKDAPITAVLRRNSPGIELQIIDEGPGIPEEEKKKIFSKFYRIGNESTRKTQGTGLGLYLCRKIARDHNADISVTNNIPRGSKFVVSFRA